jgi:hypothetical protein
MEVMMQVPQKIGVKVVKNKNAHRNLRPVL